MATMTRANMITLVLQRLGVVGQGQSASAADALEAGKVVDSVHDRLSNDRLAPFPTSEFPEWAQMPFADVAALDLVPLFSIGGERASQIGELARRGRKELARQVASQKHRVAICPPFF